MLSGKLIAKGTTADVCACSEGQVLKLFHAGQSRDRVNYEAHIGRIVAAAGLAVPRIFEVIEHEERWGIVYEHIMGTVLGDLLRPWNAKQHGRQMARLHTTLFSQHVPDLPRQRERLAQRVSTAPRLTDEERRRTLDLLEHLPDSDMLCHGDFHMANLIQTHNGLIIIDWTDATQGHPTADIARTILILEEITDMIELVMPQILGDGPKIPLWAQRLVEQVIAYTLRRLMIGYREEIERLVPDAKVLIPRWMPVLAAARLHEGQYTLSASSQTPQSDQRRIDRMVNLAREGV